MVFRHKKETMRRGGIRTRQWPTIPFCQYPEWGRVFRSCGGSGSLKVVFPHLFNFTGMQWKVALHSILYNANTGTVQIYQKLTIGAMP
jgi:hypothetical protein